MVTDPSFILALGTLLASGGVAWGGATMAIKGVKETQTEVKDDLHKHMEADAEVQLELVDRLARIETKLDALKGK
jgi:hypothetical protein